MNILNPIQDLAPTISATITILFVCIVLIGFCYGAIHTLIYGTQ